MWKTREDMQLALIQQKSQKKEIFYGLKAVLECYEMMQGRPSEVM